MSPLPVFIPSSSCLTPPDNVLYDVENEGNDVIVQMDFTSDGDYVITVSNEGILKVRTH